ncbi:MAG: class I SAM-dependent methyltransferase [Candidatus Aminicenantes bacterium]|nr:class I SAM-dependent methyltransferase [Candidatus Aminicenantes bacterium]
MEFTRPPNVATEREIRASYDALFRRAPLRDSDAHYAWVARVLSPDKGTALLDIACGGGYFLREALARGVLAVGVDISTEALKIARENAPGAALFCGNGESLPFGEDAFECAVNLGSLEHFLDPARGVREMARVLKPGGRAVLLLPNSYFLMTIFNVWRTGSTGRRTEQEVDRWATRGEWTQLLVENGLRVLSVLKYNYRARKAPLKYRLIRPFIPRDLSYCFLFVCRKAAA